MNLEQYINSPLEISDELKIIFNGKEVTTLFDIGSCEGEDAIRYSRFFPTAEVHAFEPRPDNLKVIDQNLDRFGKGTHIIVHSVALSDSKGTFDFYMSSGQPDEAAEGWNYGNKSSSLLPPSVEMEKHTSWLQFNDKISVATERMDTFCSEKNISKVDFMHIDVQGAELKVLEGAGKMLNNTTAIWMEVEAVELYKGQPLKTDVEKFMQSKNFICVLDTVNNVAGDQLYVNEKLVAESAFQKLKQLQQRKKFKSVWRRIRNGILRRIGINK